MSSSSSASLLVGLVSARLKDHQVSYKVEIFIRLFNTRITYHQHLANLGDITTPQPCRSLAWPCVNVSWRD
jgi:hypothetical protein